MPFHKKEDSEEARKNYKLICDSRRNYQLQEARQLCRDAGVNLNNGGDVGELRLFQAYLSEYEISVFTDRRGREVLFEGPKPFEDENRYYLDLI